MFCFFSKEINYEVLVQYEVTNVKGNNLEYEDKTNKQTNKHVYDIALIDITMITTHHSYKIFSIAVVL